MTQRDIGQRLRAARKDANFTQQMAAHITGYSLRQIRRIETKGTNSLFVINTISKAYGIHPALIIFALEEVPTIIAALTKRNL